MNEINIERLFSQDIPFRSSLPPSEVRTGIKSFHLDLFIRVLYARLFIVTILYTIFKLPFNFNDNPPVYLS